MAHAPRGRLWRLLGLGTLRWFAAQGDMQAALPRPARLYVILSEERAVRRVTSEGSPQARASLRSPRRSGDFRGFLDSLPASRFRLRRGLGRDEPRFDVTARLLARSE